MTAGVPHHLLPGIHSSGMPPLSRIVLNKDHLKRPLPSLLHIHTATGMSHLPTFTPDFPLFFLFLSALITKFSPTIIFFFIFLILVSIIIFEVYFEIVFALTPWIGNYRPDVRNYEYTVTPKTPSDPSSKSHLSEGFVILANCVRLS